MDVFSIYRAASHFRTRRLRLFEKIFRPTSDTRILDVGGFPQFWASLSVDCNITILRPEPYSLPAEFSGRFDVVVGDGTRLNFTDGAFDIVFSNSVIEHVGDSQKQAGFASETQRVGRGYWVQTPAQEFFMEPHLITPFIHWFPKNIQKLIIPRFTVWALLAKNPQEQELDDLLGVRMLTKADIQRLFPHGTILVEKCLGIPKSYVAYRRA